MSIDEYFGRLGVIHTDNGCNVCDNPAVIIETHRMKGKIFWGLLALFCSLAIYMFVFHMDVVVAGMPSPKNSISLVADEKGDGECTGHETVGRCADKCPTGSYEIGHEDNGAAICKNEPTGCPYSENAPIGPECEKAKPVDPTVQIESIDTPDYPEFVGK